MRLNILAATIIAAVDPASTPTTVAPPATHVRTLLITSPDPGHQVRFQGIVLFPDRPMRLLNGVTPFEIRVPDNVVLGAFEAEDSSATLTLTSDLGVAPSATTSARRVMMGQSIGGVSTAFVQHY